MARCRPIHIYTNKKLVHSQLPVNQVVDGVSIKYINLGCQWRVSIHNSPWMPLFITRDLWILPCMRKKSWKAAFFTFLTYTSTSKCNSNLPNASLVIKLAKFLFFTSTDSRGSTLWKRVKTKKNNYIETHFYGAIQ